MNKINILKFVIVLSVPFLTAAEFTDYTTLLNQKMETERRMEAHLSGIVERIVGEDKATVIVGVDTADLSRSRVQREEVEEEEEDVLPDSEDFLPGIPSRPQLDERDEERRGRIIGKTIEDVVTLPSEFIRGIRVSLIIDSSIPEELVVTTEAMVRDIVNNIAPHGENFIELKTVDFAERGIDFIGFLFNPYFYVIALVVITLTIISLFLFGPLKRFLFAALQTLKDLKAMKSETEYSGGAAGGGSGMGMSEGEMEVEEESEEEEEKGEEAEEDEEGEEIEEDEEIEGEEGDEEEEFKKMTYKPLKFLENKDLKKIAYLLTFEKPDVAALLIDYLDPPKAAKVMAALPRDIKAEVAKSVIKIQRTSKEIMQHIDEFLSKKIDYVSGGADQLVSVLEVMNEEEREKLIQVLSEDDPEFAEKVKSRIFSFENIVDLSDSVLQLIIQEIDTKDLGMALKNVPEEIKQKFMDNMSEGAAALLKEEIEFGRNITEGQMKEKQNQIVTRIKELEREGTITGVTSGESEELWEEELGEEEREGVLEEIIEAAQQALEKKAQMEDSTASKTGANDEEAFKFYEEGLNAYKHEEYERAIKMFNKSISFNPGVWQTYQYLGSCYLALGDENNARDAYSKSLELNPQNEELREWLKSH